MLCNAYFEKKFGYVWLLKTSFNVALTVQSWRVDGARMSLHWRVDDARMSLLWGRRRSTCCLTVKLVYFGFLRDTLALPFALGVTYYDYMPTINVLNSSTFSFFEFRCLPNFGELEDKPELYTKIPSSCSGSDPATIESWAKVFTQNFLAGECRF
jgi:hypothetical protein